MTLELEPVLEAGLPPAVLVPDPTTRRRFVRFRDDRPTAVDEEVITEIRFSIFVGEREVVSLMCSPWKLRELVLGFLYIEGFLDGPDDVELLRVCLEDRMAEVVLRGRIEIPERKILTSGRISSEMLLKSAIMGVPLVASRTSPTELAVTLAERLNITLVGYVRPGSMNVYAHPWRLSGAFDPLPPGRPEA